MEFYPSNKGNFGRNQLLQILILTMTYCVQHSTAVQSMNLFSINSCTQLLCFIIFTFVLNKISLVYKTLTEHVQFHSIITYISVQKYFHSQALGCSISLAPLYPCLTNDLHVSIETSFHQSFLWLDPTQV